MTAKIPGAFESPANEWYVWKPSSRLSKDVHVLVSLDPSNYPIGLKDILTGGDLPVVWTNTKYKMLYMNMGHGDKIFASPLQNDLIDNAVNWLGMGATPAKGTAATSRIGNNPDRNSDQPRWHRTEFDDRKFYAVNTAQNQATVLDGDGRLLARLPLGKGARIDCH